MDGNCSAEDLLGDVDRYPVHPEFLAGGCPPANAPTRAFPSHPAPPPSVFSVSSVVALRRPRRAPGQLSRPQRRTGVGPTKRFGEHSVEVGDELSDPLFEFVQRCKRGAGQNSARQDAAPDCTKTLDSSRSMLHFSRGHLAQRSRRTCRDTGRPGEIERPAVVALHGDVERRHTPDGLVGARGDAVTTSGAARLQELNAPISEPQEGVDGAHRDAGAVGTVRTNIEVGNVCDHADREAASLEDHGVVGGEVGGELGVANRDAGDLARAAGGTCGGIQCRMGDHAFG